MNDDKLTKVPVSELTESDKAAFLDRHADMRKKKPSKKKPSPLLVILGVVILGGLGTGLYFLLRGSGGGEWHGVDDELKPIDLGVRVVQVDSAETTPSPEYVAELESVVNNAEASPEERRSAEIDLAISEIQIGKLTEAEARLDGINRDELGQRELYILYDAYSHLYEASGNDAKHDEYATLLDEITNKVWADE